MKYLSLSYLSFSIYFMDLDKIYVPKNEASVYHKLKHFYKTKFRNIVSAFLMISSLQFRISNESWGPCWESVKISKWLVSFSLIPFSNKLSNTVFSACFLLLWDWHAYLLCYRQTRAVWLKLFLNLSFILLNRKIHWSIGSRTQYLWHCTKISYVLTTSDMWADLEQECTKVKDPIVVVRYFGCSYCLLMEISTRNK